MSHMDGFGAKVEFILSQPSLMGWKGCAGFVSVILRRHLEGKEQK